MGPSDDELRDQAKRLATEGRFREAIEIYKKIRNSDIKFGTLCNLVAIMLVRGLSDVEIRELGLNFSSEVMWIFGKKEYARLFALTNFAKDLLEGSTNARPDIKNNILSFITGEIFYPSDLEDYTAAKIFVESCIEGLKLALEIDRPLMFASYTTSFVTAAEGNLNTTAKVRGLMVLEEIVQRYEELLERGKLRDEWMKAIDFARKELVKILGSFEK